ncbi:MAG: exodeoxyribonuclease VII large subunit [Bacillota bacterium]|jgi:exodeoxyribonuclease VII large subunit|nr:exodeoxyribonuclease VII large subunit [Candidatus Fermentithermobacillaceae bacterium]
MDPNKAITVSRLNAYVRDLFRSDDFLREVMVRGEIGNLRNYQGHLYFTLKDEKASIKAVMWRSDASRLSFVPSEGAQVIAAGSVSVFERDGVYQLYVSFMEPSGLGALYAALEKLKEKLEKEGLFRQERKRPLPFFPRKIGLVTSIRGAAIKDIISVGRRRFRGVSFVVADSKVQGEGAAGTMVRGIQALNEVPGVDVIIIGRGGGSQEDLFVFNDETLARAIYASRVPVVSAVGHERDVTVADLVADARAATPSQAAELVVPAAADLLTTVSSRREDLRNEIYKMIGGYRQTLSLLRSRPALERPDWFLVSSRETLIRLARQLEAGMAAVMEKKSNAFMKTTAKLDALSPLRVLSRGFSLVRRMPDGVIVRDARLAPKGTEVEVSLMRGSLVCRVEESLTESDLIGEGEEDGK